MRIEVDGEKIRRNAEAIVGMCAPHGIEVVGVTKACSGHPEVARAMLAGGVAYLAESRLSNVRRLRDAGIDVPILLLRLPAASEVDSVVALTQQSLNSEAATLRALSAAARARDVVHQVILMVEAGDRREGVMPDEVPDLARLVLELPNLRLMGLGINLACLCGVLPSRETTQTLVDLTDEVERTLGVALPIISGGHSADLGLVGRGEMPARVNQLRIGGAILRGASVTARIPLPCPHQDPFRVAGEVIEVKTKPSLPGGEPVFSTFDRPLHWEDKGLRRRAILALGELDVHIEGLTPVRPGVTIIGASSDHLVLDVTGAEPGVEVGDELAFLPSYSAIATAMSHGGAEQAVRPVAV